MASGFQRRFLVGATSVACPSGMIAWFNLSSAPDGWVICDGRSYVDSKGVTRTAPNLINKYTIGSKTSDEIGTAIQQNLPNITGEVSSIVAHGTTWTGAFWKSDGVAHDNYDNAREADAAHRGDTAPRKRLTFNAHNSYSTYGYYGSNSKYYNKVIPDSVRLLPCIKK